MFNVAVIRLKDIVRYVIVIMLIITIITFSKKNFNLKNLEKLNIGQKVSTNIEKYIKESIDIEIPEVAKIHSEKNEKNTIDEKAEDVEDLKEKILSTMLNLELGVLNIKEDTKKTAENIKKSEENNKEENKEEKDDDKNIELAKTGLKTEVITKNPIVESFNIKYKGVKIKNETSFDLTDEDLNPNNLKINKSNIIIFHTHTCESYTSSEQYPYTPIGNYRTTDLKYSVVKVGDELEKYLKKYNINVIHNKTYHDYPSYSGSYSRSLSTVTKILQETKADIIIDLHRDAIGSNSSYAPTIKIGDDECAQIMFVMGSNGGGLKHSNWKNNLKFAVKMQEIGNNSYPGLFKPIILRNSRYNQHLGEAACIIEVGATGNTLEQCLNSMKYLAEIINEFD